VLQFLQQYIAHLWPNGIDPETRALDWGFLFDPTNASAEARLNWQYWRANIDPSERYVLSVPNSIAARIPSEHSGFDNLYLAGDWTKNGLDAGCVEAAVMSGMQASRGISGYPLTIIGEQDRL
jgi:uncharacterized protein with NAD-binding domain and iron-sulfur cluster